MQLIDSVLTIPLSVSETAINAGLTSFAGAVTTANLNIGQVTDGTFFAPTNEAFETVGSALTSSDADLTSILQYHYLNGQNNDSPLYTSKISSGSQKTAEGSDVSLSYNDGSDLFVNTAAVTYANLLVQNGVIQIIDQVLNPNSNSSSTPSGGVGLPAFPDATRSGSAPFVNAVAGKQSPVQERTPVCMAAITYLTEREWHCAQALEFLSLRLTSTL